MAANYKGFAVSLKHAYRSIKTFKLAMFHIIRITSLTKTCLAKYR